MAPGRTPGTPVSDKVNWSLDSLVLHRDHVDSSLSALQGQFSSGDLTRAKPPDIIVPGISGITQIIAPQ